MADSEHVRIFFRGAMGWQAWRDANPGITPDLSGANLSLSKVQDMNTVYSRFSGPPIDMPSYRGIDLSCSDLSGANLEGHLFSNSDFSGANLTNANLTYVTFVDSNLSKAVLNECRVFGVSAWNVDLTHACQSNLYINKLGGPEITVDSLEIAQFINVLINNSKVREVIDTITSKVVLILGRFSPERKPVLDRLRDKLRLVNRIPVVFDCEPPKNRDLTESVSTLAHLAKFIIADITDPRSIPQELVSTIPGLPSVPVQPIIQSDSSPYGMFEHIQRYSWVRPVLKYDDLASIDDKMIGQIVSACEPDPLARPANLPIG